MSRFGGERHAPSVSVVIPAYNAAETLPACLAALRRQTVPLAPHEIVVVDDGSEDGTAAIPEAFGVRLIRQRHENQAAARNRGAQATSGAILLFTDADCEPAPDWVERMLAPFADPAIAGVKGRYRTKQTGLVPRFIQHEFEQKYAQLSRATQLDFIDGYAAAYRREAFLALGGFDPRYAPVEDIELSFRAARHGYRLAFADDAIVYHRHRETVLEFARTKARAARLWVDVYRAHPQKLGHDSRRPWLVLIQIGLAGIVLGFGAAGVIARPARLVSAAAGGALLASSFPLVRRAASTDPGVAAVAPLLTAVRAFSQAVGIAVGVAHRLARLRR
ncbi:MAG: glycosyltransferase [Chloroflexota bacterium]|nr:glycosyltransferase [Dehalococcoidia bacterium]MDW8252758.1 glycosyltransferase [Chloroflexota bacterium]